MSVSKTPVSTLAELPFGQNQGVEEVDSNLSEMGFTSQDVKNLSIGSAPAERLMTPAECGKALDEIIAKARFVGVNRKIVLNTILWYFVENGSSPRGPYGGTIEISGKKFPARIIAEVLHGNQRRFARSLADVTFELMKANPDRAKKIADLRGFRGELWPYAFDTAEDIRGLQQSILDRIQSIRALKLATSAPYESIDTVTAQKVKSEGTRAEILPQRGNTGHIDQGW